MNQSKSMSRGYWRFAVNGSVKDDYLMAFSLEEAIQRVRRWCLRRGISPHSINVWPVSAN